MTSTEAFERAIDQSHRALDEIAKGNPDVYFELYSDSEDATLANPFGPPARGRAQIEQAGRAAASNYREGGVVGFETVAKHLGADLGYTVEIERFETKLGGSDELTPVALRVTSIYRPEGDAWKLIHRHADPITTARRVESVAST